MKTKPSWRQKWKIYNDEKNNNNSSNKTTKNDVHWSIRMGPCFLLGSLISRLLSPSLWRLPIFLPLSVFLSLSPALYLDMVWVFPARRYKLRAAGVRYRSRESRVPETARISAPSGTPDLRTLPASNCPPFRDLWIIRNSAKLLELTSTTMQKHNL